MKIVQIPRKLWVGSYEFLLHLVGSENPVLEGEDGQMDAGVDKAGIYISDKLDSRRRLEIVLHEITHAINWVYEIDEAEKKIEEEIIAETHGRAWSQFYLDNPRFVSWLTYTLGRIRYDRKYGDTPATTKAPDGDHPPI